MYAVKGPPPPPLPSFLTPAMLPTPAAAWLDEPKKKKQRKIEDPLKPDHRRFCSTCLRERWRHPHGKFGPNCDLDPKLQL